MAYNEDLAGKLNNLLGKKPGFNMKTMFGGVRYLLNGNMACGVPNNDLIVRIGPKDYDKFLKHPETGKFDITGKPMKGWVMISFTDENREEALKHGLKEEQTSPLGCQQKKNKQLKGKSTRGNGVVLFN